MKGIPSCLHIRMFRVPRFMTHKCSVAESLKSSMSSLSTGSALPARCPLLKDANLDKGTKQSMLPPWQYTWTTLDGLVCSLCSSPYPRIPAWRLLPALALSLLSLKCGAAGEDNQITLQPKYPVTEPACVEIHQTIASRTLCFTVYKFNFIRKIKTKQKV